MMIRNVVFDFGNVIARFDADELIGQFCTAGPDRAVLRQAIFFDWAALDAGRVPYEAYLAQALERLPARLWEPARAYFRDWYRCMPYVDGMPELIADLEAAGFKLYLLSNASVYLARHLGEYKVLRGFAGVVISGEIRMVKPEPGIYRHLLKTYALHPEECLFIDDLKENVKAAERCGMEGYVFDGSAARLRAFLRGRHEGPGLQTRLEDSRRQEEEKEAAR